MNRSPWKAVALGLLAGSMTGLAVVGLGWFLSGTYGAMYAFFLCPPLAMTAASVTLYGAATLPSEDKH